MQASQPIALLQPALSERVRRVTARLQEESIRRSERPDGMRVGRYIFDRTIERGGAGTVYRAHDEKKPADRVAVKVLNSRYVDEPERLVKEALILEMVRHENVVEFLGGPAVTGNGSLCFTMELLEGQPLNHMLDCGALPWVAVKRHHI